jgi:hypothetical protein
VSRRSEWQEASPEKNGATRVAPLFFAKKKKQESSPVGVRTHGTRGIVDPARAAVPGVRDVK